MQQRLTDDLKEMTKARTMQKDKWLIKEYIKNGKKDDTKDMLKVRLHMQYVKKNYPKNVTCTICPIFRKEDTVEHVLDCGVVPEKRKHTFRSRNIYHWKQILKIFKERKNKRKAQV